MNINISIGVAFIAASTITALAVWSIYKDPSLPTIVATLLLWIGAPLSLLSPWSPITRTLALAISAIAGFIAFTSAFEEKTEEAGLSQDRFFMATSSLMKNCPYRAREIAESMMIQCAIQSNMAIQELAVAGIKTTYLGPTTSLIDSAMKEKSDTLTSCEESYIELEIACPDIVSILSED
ncbi:hypothetical protein PRZ61_02980 [Halomonas pacifica]|uniref:hypothetical protein n=1 Tax=Bisbaumannia pacifica TaxID=77098 RepID=UPI002358999C|nr:hypothetical protein [Halomonas pacifica]MDC8802418.1 hypothetical protein [Halomonas pacifica]